MLCGERREKFRGRSYLFGVRDSRGSAVAGGGVEGGRRPVVGHGVNKVVVGTGPLELFR